jgi:hypothetical protein
MTQRTGRRFEDKVTRFRRSILWLAILFMGIATTISLLLLIDIWKMISEF